MFRATGLGGWATVALCSSLCTYVQVTDSLYVLVHTYIQWADKSEVCFFFSTPHFQNFHILKNTSSIFKK